AAGHQWQRGLAHVGVRAGVRVREVEPRATHADQHLAGLRRGQRKLDESQHLGAAELGYLDRSHRAAQASERRGGDARLATPPRARVRAAGSATTYTLGQPTLTRTRA